MLLWMKSRQRYLFAILAMAASAYTADRWFFSGLTASKWIGLPQYASAMNELQHESRYWGIAAIVLQSTGLLLALPRWPEKRITMARSSVLSVSAERNMWSEYFERCILGAALCLLGSLGFAILIPVIANFL